MSSYVYKFEIKNRYTEEKIFANINCRGSYPVKHGMEKFLRRDIVLSFLTQAAHDRKTIEFYTEFVKRLDE